MPIRISRLIAVLIPSFGMAVGPAATRPRESRLPFEVGERLTYNAKVTGMNAGKASISIENIETIRGVPTFHTVFDIKGRVLFKRFENHYESWFDTTGLVTMKLNQKTPDVDKHYEFYPDRKIYVKNGDGIENPSVSMPIDECSFLFYLRTLPLEVGKTYSVDRYYYADKNPIVVTVDRRERVSVPAGDFDAVVLKPVIKSNGLFSVKSNAEVWLSTDPTHTILKLRSGLPVGTLYLELKAVERPT